jgi:hypothetical protein
MPILVTPTNLQKVEFDVTTAEGPSRVTIVTGMMQANLQATGTGASLISENQSFKALLDPTLPAGAFRKATSTVSLASLSHGSTGSATQASQWTISDAQATFDDETGKTQLVVDVIVKASGQATSSSTQHIMFQVTTLAMVPAV